MRFFKAVRIDWITIRGWLYRYLLITSGVVVMAVNTDLFLAPSNIAPGGISGLSIIINHYTGWSIGMLIFLFSVPLLGLGYFCLGRLHFLASAAYVSFSWAFFTDLLASFLPRGISDDLLLNAIFAGLVGGVGVGLIYRGGSSPPGTSIISRVLQIKTGLPTGQLYLMVDGGIIGLAGLSFGWEMALYAVITLFVWGVTADYVQEGPSVIRTAFIITDRPDEVSERVLEKLNIGMTAWEGRGMYTRKEHTVLFCAINRAEIPFLKAVLKTLDPVPVVIIVQGHQALGGIFRAGKAKRTKQAAKNPPGRDSEQKTESA